MDADANVRVVLEVFAAIERRDAARFVAHTHPEVSICWPPSLPWNDGVPGRPDPARHHGQLRTWQTVGVFRIADGKIAECCLVPFDQYLFDELWS
jgi:ketosteroid isomerase-like protein